MLDMWVEEELKPGNLSNGTVMSYQGTVNRIRQYPIGKRKLKTVTADHLQAFIDFLSYGGTNPDGTTSKPMSKGYMLLFSAVLQNSFRFAVFPKKLITFNPMPVSYTHLCYGIIITVGGYALVNRPEIGNSIDVDISLEKFETTEVVDVYKRQK